MEPKRIYLHLLILATLMALIATAAPQLHSDPVVPGGTPPPLHDSLAQIPELGQRSKILGYEREHFGSGWSAAPLPHAFCEIRDLIMAANVGAELGHDCEVRGSMIDPYSSRLLEIGVGGDPVELDHVLPLSIAWDLGAHAWTPQQRRAFANDPANLVLTSREANQEKSNLLPSEWLPPDRGARCWYVRKMAHVVATYGLPFPAEEQTVMKKQCRLREIWRP